MRWLARFSLGRRDRDIAEEIERHLQMAVADRIERGETPDEARRAALREFGNVPLIRQTTRDVWSWTTVEQLLQDVRFGARMLWHSPGLSAAAVILVALVIGGNTTIYSIVHGILTRPASGVEADRLVCLAQVRPDLDDPYISYPNFLDYATHSKTVMRWAAWTSERFAIGVNSGSYAVFGALVTTNYFDTLGIRVPSGRGLRADDDRLEAGGLVAVISDRLWRDRFQRAPDVVGGPITVNGNPATIVGIAAPRFQGATLTPGEDVWVPLTAYYEAIGSTALMVDRRQAIAIAAGQLASGRSLTEAQAEIGAMSAQLQAAYPDANKDRRAVVSEYSATALLPVGRFGPQFLALFSVITALTLLIVSANVANLMLARAVVRQRETAVRQSLGASRARIVRMLLAEGMAVSLTAWAAACLFAWWTSRALIGLLEPAKQGLLPDLKPDWQVAAYAMLLATLATIAFTVAPAARTWRQQVLPWLKAGEQAVAPGRSTLSNVLVVLQLAFSVLLLTTAGLAYRSLSILDSGDVRFDKDNLLLVTVRARRTGAWIAAEPSRAEQEGASALLERVRERLVGVRNVEAVTYARRVPGAYAPVTTPAWSLGGAEPVSVFRRPVGPDYLQVLGLAPLAGRAITTLDRRGAVQSAVINQHLAARLWPSQSPLGQTLLVGDEREAFEVVGVAPNALFDGPAHNPRPNFVFTAEQQLSGGGPRDPTFIVRYQGSLESVAPTIGKAIAEVDPDLPIVSMSTMRTRLESVTEIERMVTTLLIFFATVSLIIAALGQYAIAMFNMRRRTRDFGVRLALGASSSQIEQAVIHEALQLTAIGLGIGFVLSVAVATAAKSVLFGVTPTDAPTYAGVFALLAIASLVASYLPAWRAGRVNVVDALRQE